MYKIDNTVNSEYTPPPPPPKKKKKKKNFVLEELWRVYCKYFGDSW